MKLIGTALGIPSHQLLLLLLCLLPNAVLADDLLPPDQLCVQAVFMAYNYLGFTDKASAPHDQKKKAADFCQNELKTTSIYAASKVFCAASDEARDFAPVVELLQDHCRKWGGGAELQPVPHVVANSSVDELRKRLRHVDFQEVPNGEDVDEVVLISATYYSKCFETIFSWQYTMWAHKRNGTTQYEFWGLVLLAAAAVQLYRRFLRDRLYRAFRGLRKACSFSAFQPVLECIERWTPESLTYERVPGAVATEKDSRSFFNFKLTPIGETTAIWMYWIVSITFNFSNYRFYNESIYFPEMSNQIMRYSADRTGILSYANLPILWLFSGRNNIFMWATGWKFPTFIRFHLHVAWIATLEAIAHSVLYTILTVQGGYFWKWFQTDWFFLGVIATFVMTLLLLVSTPVWLRERYYELFIDSHIISSLAVLIGLFIHTSVFDHEYDWYLWVPAILWLLDRVLRLCRILAFNFGFQRGRIQCTKTKATYDRESNIITLEIVPGPQIKAPQPGQYYFLYEPFSLRGYENHPMTLGTWRAHNPSSTSPTNENEEEDTYPLTPTTSSSPTTLTPTPTPAPTSDAFSPSQPLLSRSPSPSSTTTIKPKANATATAKASTTLTFWIRPYNGWTRRLRDRCLAGHTHPLILLEGPYGGSPHPLASYDAALLIAGGSGISAAVPYLQACARTTACDDVEGGERQQRARARMQLVWAAREERFMREVVERELGEGLARGAFGVELFCTGDGGDGAVGGSAVEVRQGRPDVEAIVAETARRVGEEVRGMPGGRRRGRGRGRVAVLLCGPPGMARGVEGAVRRAGEEFDCWVDYFDEVFSW